MTYDPLSFTQAMLLAVLQGVSELFPISSLGHTVLIPALLHWRIDRNDETFLAFVVALHLGTAVALVVFYRRDWAAIVRALVGSVARAKLSADPVERLGWLLVIGTIPVGVLGALFEKSVRGAFGSTTIVAAFLVANGFVMFLGERMRRTAQARAAGSERPLHELTYGNAATVGLAQGLALLPGISRSGCSIVAGLALDLSHEDAARYSFLLATPVIAAASLLELPKLFSPAARSMLTYSAVGGVLAAVTAYASVAFLTKYFETNDLRPFGWYCIVVGSVALVLSFTKVIV